MPAVYQLVPGSMIAKLWFNSLFPPSPILACYQDSGNSSVAPICGERDPDYEKKNAVFSNLMVIATSLALGLILGFSVVHVGVTLLAKFKRKTKHGTRTLVPW
jgi:hypothetical protein